LADAGRSAPQEATEPLARVAGIEFNTMMTGGRDQDDQPGPEVLTAVLMPVDKAGELVKLAGKVRLELLDLSRTGEDQRIGEWNYSAEEARRLWHPGIIASGYQFDLPLPELPVQGKAVLHGRMTTTDGRQFDTSCPVQLASAAITPLSPNDFPAPGQARPLGVSTRPLRDEKQTAVSDQTANDHRVEPAGFVKLDSPDSRPLRIEASPPNKPVPVPPGADPEAETAPVENRLPTRPPEGARKPPGAQPRPFPTGLQTSVNWTDETTPVLR
jgi:hypothetical protein